MYCGMFLNVPSSACLALSRDTSLLSTGKNIQPYVLVLVDIVPMLRLIKKVLTGKK